MTDTETLIQKMEAEAFKVFLAHGDIPLKDAIRLGLEAAVSLKDVSQREIPVVDETTWEIIDDVLDKDYQNSCDLREAILKALSPYLYKPKRKAQAVGDMPVIEDRARPASFLPVIKEIIDTQIANCADDATGRTYKLACENIWNLIEAKLGGATEREAQPASDTPLPGELLAGIGDIVERHYDNLKQPKPRDVSKEIYEYLCPYLKSPQPDLSKQNTSEIPSGTLIDERVFYVLQYCLHHKCSMEEVRTLSKAITEIQRREIPVIEDRAQPASFLSVIKQIIDTQIANCANDTTGRTYRLACENVWNLIESRLGGATEREVVHRWQPMDTVPKKEDEVFLVRLPGNDVCKTLAIQVSVFEGRMYPDCKDGLIDWDDAIVGADAWSPLPTEIEDGSASE